jgi:hypothetical protein
MKLFHAPLSAATALSALVFASALSAATINVSSVSGLQSAINNANPGDTIIAANGTYTLSSTLSIGCAGTSTSHITIKAANTSGSTINGSGGVSFTSGAAYVDFQGFVLNQTGSIGIPTGSDHIRVTRCTVQLSIPSGSDVSYFNISGDNVQIDHCELRNKSTLGEMLDISGSGTQVARNLWVHHNYFHDFSSPGGNGAETIRWGLSGLSLSTGNGLCEYNLFVRCTGENELISNKSSGNTYRYNTFLDSVGAQMSQRHGNFNLIYGNYFRNTDGIRIYGDDNQIWSNYLEGNSSGINIGNGDGEVESGAALTSHDKPDRTLIAFNTLINNTAQYFMQGRTGGLGASHTTFADNIIQGGGQAASISTSAPYSSPVWEGNIVWNTTAGDMPSGTYTVEDPKLVADASGVFHLASNSPAINAAVGSFSSIVVDQDGQARPGGASNDVGADEVSTAPVIAKLLTTADVGPNSGLTSPVAAPTFTPGGGNYTSAQSVSIATTTGGASIRYTTDGSTPTSTTGTLYSGPVTISATTTLKAIAYETGFTDSSVTSATYTITAGGTTISPTDGFDNIPMSSAQTGSFTATIDAVPSISPSNTTIGLCQGAQTAYTGLACVVRFNTSGDIDARNGGAYTAASTIPFSAGVSYHFRFVVNVPTHTYSIFVTPAGGSEITVGSNYAFRTEQAGVTSLDTWNIDVAATPGGTVTISNLNVTATAQVAAPTFSPGAGTYTSAQSVTISTTTSGASIRYTTDGSTPTSTTGTLYSGPVAVGSTKTLKAIAFESGFTDSTVSSATYTINLPQAAAPTFSPAGGTYTSAQSVTISTTTSGATIRYTTDGSTPTSTTGTVYSGPVAISATTTLKAIASASGFTDSAVSSATYTINTSTTVSVADGFFNKAMSAAQTGTFTATVDAVPSLSPSNITIALCQGAQTAYTGLACVARFNTSGDIDARNGGAYAAASTIPFSAGVSYHFRFVVNVTAHTYSLFVTPAGGSEITVGSNYAFRTEQNTVTSLDTWNVDVNATPGGSVTVSNLAP